MSNVSKIQTRLKMIQAVCHLMDEGVAIGEISGVAVTDYCSVDKMYISRYFGDLAGLFMETVHGDSSVFVKRRGAVDDVR
jgi:hypothetical protein